MVKMISLTVTTTINAPLEMVWQSYSEPHHITEWNRASEDWHCPYAANDLQQGGRYLARMEAKDGSMGFDFEAIYDEVEVGSKIAYTMSDGRKATTLFIEKGGQTMVTTTFDAESENSPELQQGGWQAILDSFNKYTENLFKIKKEMI